MVEIEDYLDGKWQTTMDADDPEAPEYAVGDIVVALTVIGAEHLNGNVAVVTHSDQDRMGRVQARINDYDDVLWVTPGPLPQLGDQIVAKIVRNQEAYEGESAEVVEVRLEGVVAGEAAPVCARFSDGSRWWVSGFLPVEEATEDSTDRPTVGDLVIVLRNGPGPGAVEYPQVVLIDKDDHDSAPYYGDFLAKDGTQFGYYFCEGDCEPYTGDRLTSDAPFMLNEGLSTGGDEPAIGSMVLVTECCSECACDEDSVRGWVGELVRIDEGDPEAHFLVRWANGNEDWAHRVEVTTDPQSSGVKPSAAQAKIDAGPAIGSQVTVVGGGRDGDVGYLREVDADDDDGTFYVEFDDGLKWVAEVLPEDSPVDSAAEEILAAMQNYQAARDEYMRTVHEHVTITTHELADGLARVFPDHKIEAIKVFRFVSHQKGRDSRLQTAKEAIDAAYARAVEAG